MSKLPVVSIKKATPSSRYFGFWPGMQDATDGNTAILDKSGKGRNLILGASATYGAVTPTSQYATIVGSVNASDKSLATADAFVWDMFAGQSLIMQCTMNAAVPGAQAHVFNARGASGDVKGFGLTVDSAGRPVAQVRDTGTTFGSNTPSNVITDSTPHIVTVVINGTAKTIQIFVDGTPISTHATPQAITATGGSTQADGPARWGAQGDFVTSSTPTWVNGANLLLRHMHLIVMDSYPANISAILAELLRNPHRPLSNKLLA